MNRAVERVRQERMLRGSWSIRHAAEVSGVLSNQTWSTFEKTGVVTDGVRLAVSKAFDWPMDWPENLPAVSSPLVHDEAEELRTQMGDLARLVNKMNLRFAALLHVEPVLLDEPAPTRRPGHRRRSTT